MKPTFGAAPLWASSAHANLEDGECNEEANGTQQGSKGDPVGEVLGHAQGNADGERADQYLFLCEAHFVVLQAH